MKTRISIKQILIATLVLAVSSTSLRAADDSQEVVTISTAKFGSKLVETWIKKYAEVRPAVQIRIVDGKNGEADLRFVEGAVGEKDQENVTYVGRYALLPVTTTENPLYEQIAHRDFNEKELKKLFFQNDAFQEIENGKKKDALNEGLTVYSGTSKSSGADAFAAYFGYEANQIRGKRIAGDDLFLLTAINKDHTGITFNNLAYLFDLQSRKLKPQLALLPLDLKKDQSNILSSGNLDEALQLLETEKVELVPIEEIGFIHTDKQSAADFLHWLVTEGQQYNHSAGFLTLDDNQLVQEQRRLEKQYLSKR